MPTISILIPCYNAGFYLPETIQSVLAQSYEDWELIVLDDCSIDNSYDVALEWVKKDCRIKAYRNDYNLGMLANWNKGINLCYSPLFVKLDADDLWLPTMLEEAIGVLQSHPDVGLVFSRYINIDAKGQEIAGTDVELPDFAQNRAFSCIPLVKEGPGKMLSYPVLRQGLSVMRRAVFEKIGYYKHLLTEETQAATDTEFYFRVGAHYQIFCIDKVLYKYRVHQDSISATDSRKFLSDKKLYEIKYCIVCYYADKGVISPELAARFLKSIERDYAFNKIAHLRKEGSRVEYLKSLVNQILRFPATSTAFYFRRIMEKYKL